MILQGESEKQRNLYYEFNRAEQPVGCGGMGAVYRGRMVDEKTGAFRDVAIKEVQPDGDETARKIVLDRARREASIQIRNDNLVEMLGFVETEERMLGTLKVRYYVVSEFIDGVTLDKVLDGVFTDYQGNEIAFAKELASKYSIDREETATLIIKNVLSGICALHDNGYLHRDIDPSNIMITGDGKIKLIDFGIAKKQRSLTAGDAMRSEEGLFVGKVEYASPELVAGKVSEQDFTTDIYSIGVLFYRLLTGHLPFKGTRYDIIKGQMKKKPQLSLIKSRKYRAIVGKAMAKQQQQRYSSASAMRAALDSTEEPAKLSKYLIPAIAALALLAVVIILILHKGPTPPPPPPPPPPVIDTLLNVQKILDAPMERIWEILEQEPHNAVALYKASLESEKQIPDEEAISFWKIPATGKEIKRFISSENPDITSKRLSYVLSCMAFVYLDENKWDDGSIKERIIERVKNLQSEFPDLYILPNGI